MTIHIAEITIALITRCLLPAIFLFFPVFQSIPCLSSYHIKQYAPAVEPAGIKYKEYRYITGSLAEPIIALSIVFIAIENILLSELKSWRIAIVFLFGLIHGLEFASALNEIGLPPNQFFNSILAFNLGVELEQVAVIIGMFLFIIIPLRSKRVIVHGSEIHIL